MRHFFFLLFAVFGVLCHSFSLAQELGKPFVQSYLPKQYKAATQNWCILQDQTGLMYFGNGEGVVEFDGVSWRLIQVPNKSLIRSMVIDDKGVIYVGATNEFGYLKPNVSGKLEYQSLAKLLPKEEIDFSDVWRVAISKDGVFFQTNTKLFRWANNKLHTWKGKKRFGYITSVHDKIFIRRVDEFVTPVGDSLMVIKDLKDEYYKTKETQDAITYILPYDNDKFLVYSTKKSFQIYAPNTEKLFTKLPTEIDSLIAQNGGIYSGVRQFNDTYALTIRRIGTVIMDKNGKLLQKLQKTEGLHTETHYFVQNDKQGGLWLGTVNGLSRVEANAPITMFKDKQGIDGTVYCIKRHEGILYVGTSLGLYYLDKTSNSFKAIEGIASQVWDIKSFKIGNENKLLIISTGLVEIKNFKPIPIRVVGGAYVIQVSSVNPQRVYMGGRDFILSYLYKNGKWEEEGKIIKKGETFRSLYEDKVGNLWASSHLDGVRKIIPNNATKTIDSTANIIRYDTLQGISLKENTFFVVHGEMLLGTEKGVKKFDETKNIFVPYTKLGQQFADDKYKITQFIEDETKNVWAFAQEGRTFTLGIAEQQSNGSYKWNPTPFYQVPEMTEVQIYPDDNNIVWLGGSEGLFRFDRNIKKDYNTPFTTLIRKVSLGVDSVLFYGSYADSLANKQVTIQPKNFKVTLPYQYNDLIFNFAATFYENHTENQYQYMLEGFDTEWSEWTTETKKEYTNLFEKTYRFRVKAKNIYGKESPEASYEFTILPPWYRTWWAYILYGLIGFVAVGLIVKYYTRKLQLDKEELERIVQNRTHEVTLKNAELEQQKEEIEAQRDNLKQANEEVLLKNTELEQQKEEIEAQAENLREANNEISLKNEQVEKALANIETISEIGHKITASLDLEKIIHIVYESVNTLMDATCFGIGIYIPETNSIVFQGFIERGQVLETDTEFIDKTKPTLATICLTEQREILINNIYADIHEYGIEIKKGGNEIEKSLIYLPLLLENRAVGVITVQSFETNRYQEAEVNILKTLAAYISIAIDNSHSYDVISQKNRSITDSIRYAQTIQQAMLPSEKEMQEALKEYFIFYKPKDVVSGDFYWLSKKEGYTFVAVVDCTGHGVPGAFMSMISISLLHEAVNQQAVHEPSGILQYINHKIRIALKQDETQNRDGMDIVLCKLEDGTHSHRITFAGARRPLLYTENGKIQEIRGTRKNIGGYQVQVPHFEQTEIVLNKGEMLYLSSDGYIDQSNPEREKFGILQLKDLLETMLEKDMTTQQEMLAKALEDYQGNTEQRDDIIFMGIRL